MGMREERLGSPRIWDNTCLARPGGGGLSFLFNGLSNSYTYVSRKMHLRRKSALRERLDKNKWRENKGGMGRERKTPLLWGEIAVFFLTATYGQEAFFPLLILGMSPPSRLCLKWTCDNQQSQCLSMIAVFSFSLHFFSFFLLLPFIPPPSQRKERGASKQAVAEKWCEEKEGERKRKKTTLLTQLRL